jgi:hypothetical protein
MARLSKFLGLMALAVAGVTNAAPVMVTTPAALGANDSVNWAQLGAEGTIFGPGFSANSANALSVAGSLTGANGCVATVGGSTCGWNAGPGFVFGDTVLWAEDTNGDGSGPMVLSFASVLGAGLWLQSTAFGAFTAQIDAFNGVTNIGSFTEFSANGDGIFIGVLDTISDITKISVKLQGCSGASCDFAVNSLLLKERVSTDVPEPTSLTLVLLPLLALPAIRRRQACATIVNLGESA